MFSPPPAPVRVRGSLWGPLSAYALAVIAWGILLWGLGRSNLAAALVILIGGLLVCGALAFVATGTSVTVDADTISVARRWRPLWRRSLTDFRYITENVPARPRMPALAGWRFHGQGEDEARLELAMFAPADRRALRKLFADVIVDADAGMRRR